MAVLTVLIPFIGAPSTRTALAGHIVLRWLTQRGASPKDGNGVWEC